jgi:hypothetical protein
MHRLNLSVFGVLLGVMGWMLSVVAISGVISDGNVAAEEAVCDESMEMLGMRPHQAVPRPPCQGPSASTRHPVHGSAFSPGFGVANARHVCSIASAVSCRSVCSRPPRLRATHVAGNL